MEFISPLSLTPEQRAANLAALNTRVARASAKVAADKTQSKATRVRAARNANAARSVARKVA